MSTSPTHLPPLVTPMVDPQSGLPSVEQAMWQQQLLQSRSTWTKYTPTTAHLSAITINDCAYVQAGKWTAVRIGLKGTTDGTAFTVTLPFAAKSTQQTLAAILAGVSAGMVQINPADNLTLTVTKFDNTTPVNGTVVQWIVEGAYEAQ